MSQPIKTARLIVTDTNKTADLISWPVVGIRNDGVIFFVIFLSSFGDLTVLSVLLDIALPSHNPCALSIQAYVLSVQIFECNNCLQIFNWHNVIW